MVSTKLRNLLIIAGIVVGVVTVGLAYYFVILRDDTNGTQIEDDSFTIDSYYDDTIVTYTTSKDLIWEVGIVTGRFVSYEEKNGVTVMRLYYEGDYEGIEDKMLYMNVYMSGLEYSPSYLSDLKDKIIKYNYDLYMDGCIPYRKGGIDEEPSGCLTPGKEIPFGQYVTIGIFKDFPQKKERIVSYCSHGLNFINCSIADLYERYFPDLEKFWLREKISEENIVFPLFITFETPK